MEKIVKKREVFYIHGYDPRGARHYYRLYKEHLLKQNKLNDLDASVSSRKAKNGNSSWNIVAHEDGIEVKTKYNFLSWTDIVSKNWARSIYAILISYLYTLRTHIFSGLIFKYVKEAPYITVNILYVALYISLLLILVVSMGYMSNNFLLDYVPWYIAIIVAIGLSYIILLLGIKLGNKIAVFWILNINTFMSKWSRGKIHNMDKKINTMANTILVTLEESDENSIDEILLIAHSVGVPVLVSILAKLIKQCQEKHLDMSIVKILTIAGNIPMVSFQKKANFFRDDLRYVLKTEQLTWLDYTSKADGLCFPLLDISTMVNEFEDKQMEPIILSTKFHKLYEKKFYEKHKKQYKWSEIHFWYLMSHDYAGEYDYFKITAGSQPLENQLRK